MFRRPAKPAAVPTSEAPSGGAEPSRLLSQLLAQPTCEGILEVALTQAAELAGGGVRGYAVAPGDVVVAVLGYDRTFLGTPLTGPWGVGKTRAVQDGAAELFAANPPEVRATLDLMGMREVRASLIAPLRERGRALGALALDRFTPGPFGGGPLGAVDKWAAAVAPLLGLLRAREEAREEARQLAGVFAGAVESLDFDAVGHARKVTEVSQKLGRLIGLSERELDELWYAAMLHDLGKLQGEDGHAMTGANLLHDVPALASARLGVRHHHERWDGFGEPERLAGEEIPLSARIVAVADRYAHAGDVAAVVGEGGKTLDPRLANLLEKALQG